MKLEALQDQFQKQLLAPECEGGAWVSGSIRGLSSQMRVNIYHNAYRVRLAETLRDTFEHTANYITEELFETLAYPYIESHPSTHSNIGMYGKNFPDYLKQELPSCQEVSEIALMDWLLRRAFDGSEAIPLTKKRLADLVACGENISHLKAVPTLSVCTQQWNSLDIWQAVNQDIKAPMAVALPESMTVMIWRKEHSPHFRSLSKFEADAIELVLSGEGIDSLCEILSEKFPDLDMATEFGQLFARWLDDHILSSED